ncbi:MAG TPA: carboxypeptidase-like regulatory domain-containing protein, partial [Flavisolibacter sp.]|nr:carboxypeptidase-like regulatory domain-containing protein [Flavisolibacter sp.]
MKTALYLTILLLITTAAMGQSVLSGTVYNTITKEPIANATITLNEQNKTILSDVNGMFTVDVADASSLRITATGYASSEVSVPGSLKLTIGLTPAEKGLDEL